MKKIIIYIFILTLAVPNLAFATWWNPTSWFKSINVNTDTVTNTTNNDNQKLLDRISELEKKVDDQRNITPDVSVVPNVVSNENSVSELQSKIKKLTSENNNLQSKVVSLQSSNATCQTLITKLSSAKNVITSPQETPTKSEPALITPTQNDKPYDYTKYSKTNITYYAKNPKNYLGWGTQVMIGKVTDFLASGDRGLSNNYIEIEDYSSNASIPADRMMVLIESDQDYKTAVSSLNKGDVIDVWGIGSPSQQFRTVGSSGSSSSYEPVITMQRIDKCGEGIYGCNTGYTSFLIMHQ